jgi:formate dehydrogenase gamma subunit
MVGYEGMFKIKYISRLSILLSFSLIMIFSGAAQAAHPAITLLDKNGDEVNPITGDNDKAPFSTEQTCGMCHDYDKITSGYHFQMGWDVVSDTFGVKDGKPWQISNGMMGKWCPMYFRQIAKKSNKSPDDIDLTVYDFVGFSSGNGSPQPCGACHPGGGGLEHDRDGNRYDEQLSEDTSLASTLDGDYYKSHWDKSGVVEADCFICHLKDYSYDERAYQLEQGNYQWAVVAGTGFGIVNGSVVDGDNPEVEYNKRFFNSDGTITLDVSWPPPDDNCVFCHGRTDTRKRGFTWNDIRNPDIHNNQGITCAACHPSGIDHQFAKGNASASQVANDLDGTMKNCEDCHMEGYLGSTIPAHNKLRPSHIQRISCEACHIPFLGRAAALGFESSSGELEFYIKPPTAKHFGDPGKWEPNYERWTDNKIYPFSSLILTWWANLGDDGILYPMFLREQKAAWQLYSDSVTDDNDDGIVEVNRKEEILAGIHAFEKILQSDSRFTNIHPVLVKGDKAYHLDDAGNLVDLDYDFPKCINYSISHNVAPTRLALGYNGCDDCHTGTANFFKGRRVVDILDESGHEVTVRNGYFFGCQPLAFAINSFHQRILSPVVSLGIILVIFFVILHYHSYGPKHIQFIPNSGEIKRFSLFERGIHLFRLIAFVILASTGLIMAFNWVLWQQLFFSSPQQMLLIHIVAGFVFIVTTVFGIVVWFRDAVFTSYDKEWVRKLGGYLGYKGDVAAGRFNAGQKMFYWYTSILGILISVTGLCLTFKGPFALSTVCILSTIHNLVAFMLIAGVFAHAYLGTVANPGTWRVLVDGHVTKIWAKHHHKNWYQSLIERHIIEPDPDDESEEPKKDEQK